MSIVRLVVLFSGEGTNLENLAKTLHNQKIYDKTYKIVGTVCNKPNANGIKKAKKYNIPVKIVEHKNFSSREDFDKELVKTVKELNPHLSVLLGFMRILTPVFTKNLKTINLHPSLLPLFKGADAIRESFFSDMKVAGVSMHFVSDELDGGEIIAQKCFEKEENETIESFKKKIKKLEHEIVPETIIKLAKDIA